jgi:adenylate kinase
MKVALVTGPSGSGKSFVADSLRSDFDCLSYDRLMRDSIDHTFPNHNRDKWDKKIWLDNKERLDLVAAFGAAFTWTGKRPLLVEGWQLRESVWRNAVQSLAEARVGEAVQPKLFVIQPTIELLLSQRSESKYEYHRRHATVVDCVEQIRIHQKMDLEQPWHGDVTRLSTKESTAEAVREFLSSE